MAFQCKNILWMLINISLLFFDMQLLSAGDHNIQDFYKEIKCPTCPGQSIADSQSQGAEIIRSLIKNELNKGKNFAEIREVLVKEYGKDILLTTPQDKTTLILWLAPIILLILGLGITKYTKAI